MAMFIVKPWYRKKDDAIYGAEWAGTSDPSWVRTDAAVGFSDPNPYYSGMSTTPSSPFDNIMPWAGMQKIYNEEAGWLVEIPKFYYKWTRDGVKMKLQISMSQFDGSYVSPAHADRGDGVGERDYVYVGRYKCASDYKSKTGYIPVGNETKATYRTNIHNLGANVWQNDYAMFWTIRMLYLVEYAYWNSCTKIGNGGVASDNILVNVGYTDNMPYHTGTILSSRTALGASTQYRHIEGLWDNGWHFIDGLYLSNNNVYIIKEPSQFSDNTNGEYVGNTGMSYSTDLWDCWIRNYTDNPATNGLEYAIVPKGYSSGQSTTYIGNVYWQFAYPTSVMYGGQKSDLQPGGLGAFTWLGVSTWDDKRAGCRLMILPPSRLSA